MKLFMENAWLWAGTILGVVLMLIPRVMAAEELPVINGKKAVASVNGEPITLEEFNQAIAESHAARAAEGMTAAGIIDYTGIMNRLINTRLILIEARNMDLNDLPEIRSSVDAFEKETLMKLLMKQVADKAQPDPKEVERIYKEMVRQYKIRSVKIKTEEDSKHFKEQLDDGGSFDALAKKAVEQGVAEADEEANYLKDADLTLPVAQMVAEINVGEVSPIISLGKEGFIIFKLEDLRYAEEENPKFRAEAQKRALNQARLRAAKEYYDSLKDKYVTIDEQLLNSLDFESATPGFDKLLQDKRVLARIRNGKDITVEELAHGLKKNFYHGIEMAIANKRVNKKKPEILEDILQKRLLVREAKQRGIDRSEEFKQEVTEYQNSLIFGAFVGKAVLPDIALEMEELKRYYNKNKEQYATPVMVRIEGLVFNTKKSAQEALKKLEGGTAFKWLREHAEGQVPNTAKGLMEFRGRIYSLKSLPKNIQKALADVEEGDSRLYKHTDDRFYVLRVVDVFPSRQKPFEEVKEEVREAVFSLKSVATINTWSEKLKEYYPVEIYRKELR